VWRYESNRTGRKSAGSKTHLGDGGRELSVFEGKREKR